MEHIACQSADSIRIRKILVKATRTEEIQRQQHEIETSRFPKDGEESYSQGNNIWHIVKTLVPSIPNLLLQKHDKLISSSSSSQIRCHDLLLPPKHGISNPNSRLTTTLTTSAAEDGTPPPAPDLLSWNRLHNVLLMSFQCNPVPF